MNYSIECHKGLPVEHESFLTERYGSFTVSCQYISLYYPDADVNYLLVKDDAFLTDILIFRNNGATSVCLNSLTTLPQEILEACIQKQFGEYPHLRKIVVEASYAPFRLKRSMLWRKSDDQVLKLPASMDEYYKILGSNTRQNLKRRKVKFLKAFPAAEFVTHYNQEISRDIIARIVRMNAARMIQKGIIPGIDEAYEENIYLYSQHYGGVVYIQIDGVVVAGCIATFLAHDVYLHVFAHDNDYSSYNLGEMCVAGLIEEAITRKKETFHFLWGKSELKKRLLGKNTELYSYFIYRNFSIRYLMDVLQAAFLRMLEVVRQSELLQPLKMMLKYFRRKNMERSLKHVTSSG